MNNEKNIIKVRKGINGFKYSACNCNGKFICNFNKLSDVRKHWIKEIQWGYVKLVRELNKTPDMAAVNETKRMLEEILKSYAKKS